MDSYVDVDYDVSSVVVFLHLLRPVKRGTNDIRTKTTRHRMNNLNVEKMVLVINNNNILLLLSVQVNQQLKYSS